MKKTIKRIILDTILLVGISFYNAFAFMLIYNWFIPKATGWTPIGYWLACGICVLIELATLRMDSKEDKEDKDSNEDKEFADLLAKRISKVLIISFFLGIAALVHLGV